MIKTDRLGATCSDLYFKQYADCFSLMISTFTFRFVINNTGESHNQFIRKPVYIAMAMLAYLGGSEVQTIVEPKNSK